VVPHPVHVWGRGPVNTIHARAPNMANVYGRWGTQVARPVGVFAEQNFVGSAKPFPSSTVRTGGFGPAALERETNALANQLRQPRATGTTPAPPSRSPQVFRHTNGEWQQFMGNGRWQSVTEENLPGWMKSPAPAPRGDLERAIGTASGLSSIAGQRSSPSTADRLISPPGVASGSHADLSPGVRPKAVPSAPAYFGNAETHGFALRNGRAMQNWVPGQGLFGRANGGWVQSPGYSGGGAGFRGGGRGLGGGGGHMGGGASHR